MSRFTSVLWEAVSVPVGARPPTPGARVGWGSARTLHPNRRATGPVARMQRSGIRGCVTRRAPYGAGRHGEAGAAQRGHPGRGHGGRVNPGALPGLMDGFAPLAMTVMEQPAGAALRRAPGFRFAPSGLRCYGATVLRC